MKDVEDQVGGSITLSEDKATVLMGRMRMPSLSLHGIEGVLRNDDFERGWGRCRHGGGSKSRRIAPIYAVLLRGTEAEPAKPSTRTDSRAMLVTSDRPARHGAKHG